jgi:hypothetical protein
MSIFYILGAFAFVAFMWACVLVSIYLIDLYIWNKIPHYWWEKKPRLKDYFDVPLFKNRKF